MKEKFQIGSTSPFPEVDTEIEKSKIWHVIVLNDPVNLMSYVVMVFRKVFGYEKEKAHRHMMEVHQIGRSTVWSGDLEKAEAYVHSLHQWQLAAILE